jgi:hypothetical protein
MKYMALNSSGIARTSFEKMLRERYPIAGVQGLSAVFGWSLVGVETAILTLNTGG